MGVNVLGMCWCGEGEDAQRETDNREKLHVCGVGWCPCVGRMCVEVGRALFKEA